MQLLRDLPQLRILADDARRAAAFGQLLLQQEVLRYHAPLRDRPRDHEQQMIGIDRLGEEVHRAFLHSRDRILDAAVRGHHDHGQFRVELLGRAQHAETVALGQLQIGEHHDRTLLAKLLNRRGFVNGLDDRVPLRLERMAKHCPEGVFVFYEENGRGRHVSVVVSAKCRIAINATTFSRFRLMNHVV